MTSDPGAVSLPAPARAAGRGVLPAKFRAQAGRVKAFKTAFAAGLVRDGPDPRPVASRHPALAAEAAWTAGDRTSFIAAGRQLYGEGALTAKAARRLGAALLDAGLPEEALTVLSDPRWRTGPLTPELASLLAQAWIGLGLRGRARTVLGATADKGDGWAQDRAQLIVEAMDVQARGARAPTWGQVKQLAWRLIEPGLANPAAEVLQAYLESAGAELEDVDAVLECAFTIFRQADAGPAAGLLAAMADLYDQADMGSAFLSAMAAIRAEAPDGAPAGAEPVGTRQQKLLACLAAACAATGRWRAAARRFLVTPKPDGLLRETMSELARCIGRDVTSKLELDFTTAGPSRRIFDLFPFNGEFAMLELKLAEMAPWVDRFVIIEARHTFTGQPKPLYFAEHSAAFSAFADKITHVPIEAFPAHIGSAWAREFFQRDQGVLGLKGRSAPDDLVIISDTDEIIRREAVQNLSGPLVGADLRTFKYFLNYEHAEKRPMIKAAFVPARLLASNGSSYLRIGASQYYDHSQVKNAGWHFTSIAAPEALESKFRSFSHEEWSHLDRAYFEALIDKIRSGGLGDEYLRCELDQLPASVQARSGALSAWLL